MTLSAENVLVALMTVLLGLSCWTLVTLHGLAKQAAAAAEKDKAQDQQIDENRARIIDAEEDISTLQVQVARNEGRNEQN